MNIVHLTPYYAPAYAFGGVVSAVEGMARALARRGHSVTVLTTDALDRGARCAEPADAVRNGVRVVRVPQRWLWPRAHLNLSTPWGLGRAARDLLGGADALHLHEFRTVENLLALAAAPATLPVFCSPHGTLAHATGRTELKRAWDRLLSPWAARRIGTVIGLTAAEADEARALWSAAGWALPRLAVIPNGVDPDAYADLTGGTDFRARWGLSDGPVCLFMGRLHPRKGAHLLAQAFGAVAAPDARLVIAGPDEGMRDIIAAQARADPRIVLTGYLTGAERLAALAAADLMALPAIGEGLPMIALEAMAAGLPLILSPGCNLPEAAGAGAGVEVATEVGPLADALRALLADAHRRAAMGAAGRALVAAHFTWDSVAARLEALYWPSGQG